MQVHAIGGNVYIVDDFLGSYLLCKLLPWPAVKDVDLHGLALFYCRIVSSQWTV